MEVRGKPWARWLVLPGRRWPPEPSGGIPGMSETTRDRRLPPGEPASFSPPQALANHGAQRTTGHSAWAAMEVSILKFDSTVCRSAKKMWSE